MNKLYNEYSLYDEYKYILQDPLDADIKSAQPDNYCHYTKCIIITKDNIKNVEKLVLIKDLIECLYFIYVDYGKREYDNKYWFFIGKLNNNTYFSYESGCCGTGFGLGEKSTLFLSKSQELLYNYGLTDKQRDLINNNITQRFTYPKVL